MSLWASRGVNDAGPLPGPRTLPVGIPPLPGESLESWLATLASHLDMRWGPFLNLVLPAASVSAVLQASHLNLAAHLTKEESTAISVATGIDSTAIEELTWHRFHGTVGTVDVERRRIQMVWTFGRSRFCPECLEHSGGRWQLQWRLPWVFSCLDHSCLLVDTCPTCGQMQGSRHGGLRVGRIPDLRLCGATSEMRQGCATDLSTARAVALDDDQPFLEAQKFLAEILSSTRQSFGLYQLAPTPTAQFLQDLRWLSRRFARAAAIPNCPACAHVRSSGELIAEWGSAGVRRWRSLAFLPCNSPALISAAGITAALALLRCPTLDDAARRLEPVRSSRHKAGKNAGPGLLTTKGHNPIPDAVALRALAPTMGPADTLRFRTLAPLPRWPRTLPAKTLDNIPACLWADWAIRLLPPDSTNVPRHENASAALAILLATVGNRASGAEIARALGLGSFGGLWAQGLSSRTAMRLYRHPLWTNIVEALTRIADQLAGQACPVNYTRRRQIDYRKLLSNNEWRAIFDASDFGRLDCASTGRRIRTWLFQRISTLPAETSPFTRGSANVVDNHSEAIELLGPPLARELDGIALRFLKQHNIVGEPVTWSPPLALVADLQLPGPDVDLLNIEDRHAEILEGPDRYRDVAKAMSVGPQVVRCLLERTPLPRPVCRGQRPTKQTQLEQARVVSSPQEFRRLYLHEKWSLTDIARHFGFAVQVIRPLAREYGIDLIPPSKRPRPISARWLRQEYVGKQRSLADIARELGASKKTIRMRCREYGIELRPASPAIAPEWIYREHVIRRRSIQDLAREKHVSAPTLSKRAKECGIVVRRWPWFNPTIDITEGWLRHEYVIKRRTLADMAKEANVHPQTLSVKIAELGIPVRRNPRSGATMLITEDWLREQHLIKHRTLVDMAQEAGVHYETLSKKAKRLGIPVHNGGRFASADNKSSKT